MAERGPAAVVMTVRAIRAYQLSLSFFLGRHCRHLPTCSDYAMEAIGRHGAWAGFWLGLFRVARCHPYGTHGFDPPPEEAPRHELSNMAVRPLWTPALRVGAGLTSSCR